MKVVFNLCGILFILSDVINNKTKSPFIDNSGCKHSMVSSYD